VYSAGAILEQIYNPEKLVDDPSVATHWIYCTCWR